MKTPRLKFIIKVEKPVGVLQGYWADKEDRFAKEWWMGTSYDSIVDANRVCANLNTVARIDNNREAFLFTVVARD